MKEVILRAIRGGYLKSGLVPKYYQLGSKIGDGFEKNDVFSSHGVIVGNGDFWDSNSLILDLEFWKALDKAMGWENSLYPREAPRDDTYILGGWCYYWHRFIDHLASGKSADSFFEELLSTTSLTPTP